MKAHLTQRELKSLEEMTSLTKSNIEKTSTQNKQIAAEVTDRLYNKKHISKLRNKTVNGEKEKKDGKGKQTNKSKSRIAEERLASPKNSQSMVGT